MTANIFLLSTPLTIERLSWIEEGLKFFFVQLYPETLIPRAKHESPVFTFLITGDALYSLDDPETQQVWTIILSLSAVQIICDRQELDLRGVSAGQLKVKFPEQIITTNSPGPDGRTSFWNDVVTLTRQTKYPLAGTAGWLQYESPYMHCSAGLGLEFLSAALAERLSTEMYFCLDGVHIGHNGQSPTDMKNIGKGIEDLSVKAAESGLSFQAIAFNQDAMTRGYSTWDDEKGIVISTCMIKQVKIRDRNEIIDRFRQNHVILSATSCNLQIHKGSAPSFDRAERSSTAPPVTVLITKSPYSTEIAFSAISLAIACANAGILTRVIFIEDGVYALTSTQLTPTTGSLYNIQNVINEVAGSENLHFFVLTPSFLKRGVTKEKSLNAVFDIGYPGLAKIFFYPPANVQAEHQRVLLF
jgi:tRNA 2-thiouridine synthesizing protein C